VKTLVEGGGVTLPGCISTNIIAQVFWGALFCLPFGFSFAALRISTLTLAIIGVVALYGLLREVDAGRGMALFGALLLAFNPLYFELSYTFMPDVPFVAISVLALYFLVRGMRRKLPLEIAAGLFFACVALLIRQNGLAIFIAFALAYLVKNGLRLRSMFLAGIPVVLGGMVQALWQLWLAYRHNMPADYSIQTKWILSPHSYLSWHAVAPFTEGLIVISLYLGLFLFPILLFMGRQRLAELCRPRWGSLAALVFAALAGYVVVLRHQRMPLLPNVLYDFGLGPVTLHDTYILRLHSLPTAGTMFWFVLTMFGLLGAVVLAQVTLVAVGKTLRLLPVPTEKRDGLLLLLGSGLLYLAPIAILSIRGWIADRYLLYLVALAICVVTQLASIIRSDKPELLFRTLAVTSLVIGGAFSIAGTHDYLTWNRVRWQALNDLATEQGVTADDVDGGYEFNGWYLYASHYHATPEKSWWYVVRDDFMVTFGSVPNFSEYRCYSFRRWLPPAQGKLLVLRKTTASGLHN
jgi:hypothetical protein